MHCFLASSFLLPVTLEGEKCTLLSALGMQEGNAHKSSSSLPFSVMCRISNNNALWTFGGSTSMVEYHYRYVVAVTGNQIFVHIKNCHCFQMAYYHYKREGLHRDRLIPYCLDSFKWLCLGHAWQVLHPF